MARPGLVVVGDIFLSRSICFDDVLDFAITVVVEVLAELGLGIGELDTVLWALRSSDGRYDRRQIQLEILGVLYLRSVLIKPHALFFSISLDESALLFRAASQA